MERIDEHRGCRFSWGKNFLLNVLSSTVGFIIGGAIMTVLGLIIIGSIVSSSDRVRVEDKSLLHIHLSGVMQEQQRDNMLGAFLGSDETTLGLEQVLTAIDIAKTNDKIKGIYLEGGILDADPASLQEVRRALVDFKKSGKPVYAYADNYMQGTYYLCSMADKVVVNPIGMVDWHGLSTQITFYKDLMAKLGVKMQVFKVGTYKSAVEPFTETQMSAANREQVTAFLGDIWQTFVNDVAGSRKLTAQTLNALADSCLAMVPTEKLKSYSLVDDIMYRDDFTQMLKKQAGLKDDDKLRLVSPETLCRTKGSDKGRNCVAVYYAEGDIVDIEEMSLMGGASIVAPTVNKDLKSLADDKDIKAVVIRINSGGGSAFASEQIWHQVKQLAKKKPVVVSMGGLAASGGYYISVGADYIFAEPTTLTGSIGIFGLIPDASELLNNKLSLHSDVVKTNRFSDFGNMYRPFSQEESNRLQAYVNNGYSLFLSRVAEGRHKNVAQIDSIAQGRVWTGQQALKLGLVDKLGTLQDAIQYAATKANLGNDYSVASYPEVMPWYANLALGNAGEQAEAAKLRSLLGDLYEPFVTIRTLSKGCAVYARVPYAIRIK